MRKKLNPIPKVAAIHDLSGFGRSSLTVVIPILSTMGIQVCPMPTAVLSTHCGMDNYHLHDLTSHLSPIIEHWKTLDISFDAIYSGYLGSDRQVGIVSDFINHFSTEDQLVVVDPVLGDNGKLYSSMTEKMVEEMRKLITQADIITPNLTEACLLLDRPYKKDYSNKELKDFAKTLSEMGSDIVIITSIKSDDIDTNTGVIAYNASEDRYWKVSCDYMPANYPGTGDAFASIITGALLQGDSLPMALDRAVQFISLGIRATFGYSYDSIEGFLLEKVLPALNMPVQISSYQLLD